MLGMGSVVRHSTKMRPGQTFKALDTNSSCLPLDMIDEERLLEDSLRPTDETVNCELKSTPMSQNFQMNAQKLILRESVLSQADELPLC